ncbi:H+-translocating NAD(P) transhydrogenase subunit alpha [Methylomarinovum caldicuralii]|uniref:NAD(P) transhydrogenase subunit alpha n=1 Tax=Methylomarinovum caldicuralii TaxID=438856 RepID=A0AAU9C096_9GAMM|nr:Re/Si-specific NAD(P)(+) transhydrogenase subunit alpha [Methylomarinovum caldicuralii]BCX82075.1 H+-translocating NAD(P) transhydrogenase subunit alpha [Methylomarinovum caldicuralii]
MRIGVPREVHEGERRVATTPQVAEQLRKLGFTVAVEKGAGEAANFPDDAYREAGAEIIDDARRLWAESDIVLKVRPPEVHPFCGPEVELLREGGTLIGFVWPAQNQDLLQQFAARKATVLAMDCIPRISRAQKMDALSSMANCAGYRAVIEAAEHFGSFFTGQVTAAGKVPPAKVLVIGAGVAGLAAIGAAVGMGAIVRAFDVRPEVRDQVESLGAEFLQVEMDEEAVKTEGGYAKEVKEAFIKKEMELFARQAEEVDIIITTALIPGKPAPTLITAGMVESMKTGSVIVDLAAEQGGNCELTEPGKVVKKYGVTIVGYTDLPSRMPTTASQLYATNLRHLLGELCPEKDGIIHVDMDDVVIRSATVVKEGQITWPPPPIPVSKEEKKPAAPPPVKEKQPEAEKKRIPQEWITLGLMALAGLGLYGLGLVTPPEFLSHFTVFVLACFVGYMVIWNVTPALHTPLMSVTNAISGIIVIGALIQISSPGIVLKLLAFIAVLIASVNIFGGFWVTQRMLGMFKKGQ